MPFTAEEIARHLKGQVQGDGSIQLTGLAPAETARPGDLTYAENEKYFAFAEKSAASAVLVSGDLASSTKVLIKVANTRVAFARILSLFFPPPKFTPGVHPSTVVAPSAQIDASAHIGPFCVIGERVSIGPRTVLEGGNHIGADCKLGEDTHLFPNVTVYARSQIGNRVRIHSGSVIGADGFGYAFDQGRHLKVPQIGNVVIHDDVELGAVVTVDRGAMGSTVIGKGTKIDNHVQVAHNVVIGEHCIMISHAAVAGSTRIGNYVTLAGQAGLIGHLKIGDRVIVGAQAGVTSDIPDDGRWLGSPAMPDRDMKRQWVALRHLPELLKRVRDLEARQQTEKEKDK